MATHSSVLAWRIPEAGSLVGCRLWGRAESDTTEATEQQQQQQSLVGRAIYKHNFKKLKILLKGSFSHTVTCAIKNTKYPL